MPNKKICHKCGRKKPFKDFHKATDAKSGVRSTCKDCTLAANRTRYQARKAYHQERGRTYRRANKERVNAANRKYRQDHPEWYSALRRVYGLKYLYGIGVQEVESMAKTQGGKCAVGFCNGAPEAVDHCHETGVVRGLLCQNCNKALGLLKENVNRIRGLANYVEMHV